MSLAPDEFGEQSGPGSLLRGLSILDALMVAGPNGLGHAALGHQLNLQRSTLYRYLGLLLELGYIERIPETHRYRLGARCVVIGAAALQERDFPRLARPYVAELAQATGKTAHATIFHDQHAVTVELSTAQSRIGSCIGIGSRRPAHRSASGRVFLAYSRAEDLRQSDALSAVIPVDSRLLEAVRRQRFALDQGEFISGVACIAAPVFDGNRTVVGALSISLATNRLSELDVHQLRQPLLTVAGQFSSQLGKIS